MLLCFREEEENVSGYYRNLGSLRAGTRHHGETLRYGNSFPPTFPEVLLAHASPNDWPIVAKHANTTSSRGSINAEPATIMSESDTERRLAGLSSDHGDHRDCLVPALREPRLR